MNNNTNEQALERVIEKSLTGTCREDLASSGNLNEDKTQYRAGNGYYIGSPLDFNSKYAIDEKRFWDFLESTQSETLTRLKKSSDWKLKILNNFDRSIKLKGVLHLLKKGLEIDGEKLHLFYQIQLTNNSETIKKNFESNQFSVTRQVPYNPNTNETIDMVIFINGIPISTIELKNPWTGQTAELHAIKQYKYDRDPKQPLLNFGRCLVHFAVDTEEVFMTTKLEKEKTFFLPFNKGYNEGKGNPPNPFGHRTSYLWEEIFKPESLANIIQHFVRLDGKDRDSLNSKTLFFPRYHQLDVVRKIIENINSKGVGQRYLIQHSAGSGKSNSITWLAFHLIELKPATSKVEGFKDYNHPLFDSVIVITDRTLLDRQLRDNIKGFSEVKNIVAHAETSKDLKENLENGKKINITTIQKFPVIYKELDSISLANKNFAIIIDEAHSSQGGATSNKMNSVIGAEDEEEEVIEDIQDKISKVIDSYKMKKNVSYFAFTATPKPFTLEKFGVKQEDGSFKEFHLYSMKQAIEEGFILDVLHNYTTYKSYYEIRKAIEDNPEFNVDKAQKVFRAYVEGDKIPILNKAEEMINHFIDNVYKPKRLRGQAKGMIVTKSIESAIRYYNAVKEILKDKGNPFKVLIAFSGTKKVDGIEYTESGMNNYSDNKTKEKFDEDDYKILIVANKYLTGFDQPKLCAMYIDKKLQGVLAVQALSRLNRTAPKLGKRTEDLFILDFFNTVDDMRDAFSKYYTTTDLSRETDPNALTDIKDSLDNYAVYEWSEVVSFNELYFNKAESDELNAVIDIASNRFNSELNLDDISQKDFKIKAKQFVKLYGQICSIISFKNVDWEMLYWFLKFLIPKLRIVDNEKENLKEILESVDLTTYGLVRTNISTKIILDDSKEEFEPINTNPRSAHTDPENRNYLDDIIIEFNNRWFEGWEENPEDMKVRFYRYAEDVKSHKDFNDKYKNNKDNQNKKLAFENMMDDIIFKNRKIDASFHKQYTEEAFKRSFIETMMRYIGY